MPIKNPFKIGISRFDRYILEEIAGALVGSCIFILGTLLMFQALRLAEFLIVHGAPATLLMKMTCYMGLALLPAVIPLSFLISILVAFGRLSSDSELVAMKACGVSIQRMAAPIFAVGTVLAVLALFLNTKWVPWGEIAFKKAEWKLGNTKAVSAIKEGTFTSGFFDLLIFADKVNSQDNRLQRVFIFDEREAQNPLAYVAREAEIVPIKTQGELGSSIMLKLMNGSMHHNNLDTHIYEKMEFENYHLYLKIAEGSDEGEVSKFEAIPQEALLKKIQENPPENVWGRIFRGEYWRRYAVAISPLVFVFLGIGFGTYRQRTAKAGAFLTGFLVLVVYWLIQMASALAVQKGSIPPILAMQIPNIVLLVVGLRAFFKAAW